jgi:hypothetical protein
MAWDILTMPALSVPCERLFLAGKFVVIDHHSILGPELFNTLQITKLIRSKVYEGLLKDKTWVPEEKVTKRRMFQMLLTDTGMILIL